MTRWYLVVLLTALGWTSQPALAQGPYGPPPGALPGVPQPEMFHGHGAPVDWAPQAYGPAYSAELVPDAHGHWAAASRSLRPSAAFDGAWIRADYLLWDIQGPGNELIGAPMATQDPNSAFNTGRTDLNGVVFGIVPNLAGTVLSNQNGGLNATTFPVGRVGTMELAPRATTDQLNGVRIAAGAPMGDSQFEMEAFVLQEAQSNLEFEPRLIADGAGSVSLIPALTLLTDGLPSDTNFILFSDGYQASLASHLWGTEANYVMPTAVRGSLWELEPILGFRYSRFGDKLSISGVDTQTIPDANNAPVDVVLNHRINASMSNHLFGPQVGLRAGLKSRWLSLMFEPKIAATINRATQDLTTQQIYNTTEAPRHVNDQFTEFSPTLDLAVMAKLHITPNFSLNVGYDYMLTGSVYRAYDNIAYTGPAAVEVLPNNPDPTAPTIGLQKDQSNMYIHGVMVGGEWIFR